MDAVCVCGSSRSPDSCCAALHRGERDARTAEELMRSRYAAFVFGDLNYLERTHDPETRSAFDRGRTEQWLKSVHWNGLRILDVVNGSARSDRGIVEFVATFTDEGESQMIHERSRFRRHQSRWVYIDGQTPQSANVGRNSPCPCGSGRKYKRCCGR